MRSRELSALIERGRQLRTDGAKTRSAVPEPSTSRATSRGATVPSIDASVARVGVAAALGQALTMTSSLRPKLVEAVDRALAGDWERAHLIVQDHEGDLIADWIHAVVHRMEGDLGNARYWYSQCGRKLREKVSTQDELREIREDLGR